MLGGCLYRRRGLYRQIGVGSQKGNRGIPCTVPVQDRPGRQPRRQAPAQSAQSTWDPKIPPHQHNRAAPPTPTPKPSIHQRHLYLAETNSQSTRLRALQDHCKQSIRSKILTPRATQATQNLNSTKSVHCSAWQGLCRKMKVGSQEPAHCSRGGAVGAARGMSIHEAGSAQ